MHNVQPKVSVIVLNYNYARYLEQRIDSVLNQSFQDFELIILDDKSNDNSREVIEKYRSHPRVTSIVYNNENSGSPCRQWEKGCRLAKGEYVWFAEADDFAEESLLEKAVRALDAEPDAVYFFAGSLQNRNDGPFNNSRYDRKNQPRYKLPEGCADYVIDGQFYIDHYLVYSNCIYNASGVVFRREAADEQAWEYVSGFHRLGDWALWSYLARKGKVIISREKLNRFRRHRKNATQRFTKEYESLCDYINIVRDNVTNLDGRRRMVMVMRVYTYAQRTTNREQWETVEKVFCEYFGKYFISEAKRAYFFNKLLFLTPWHISRRNDQLIRP